MAAKTAIPARNNSADRQSYSPEETERSAVPGSFPEPHTHPLGMQILHCFTDRVQDRASFPLREKFLSEDFIQQLPSPHQLSHQVHVLPVVVHLPKQTGRG